MMRRLFSFDISTAILICFLLSSIYASRVLFAQCPNLYTYQSDCAQYLDCDGVNQPGVACANRDWQDPTSNYFFTGYGLYQEVYPQEQITCYTTIDALSNGGKCFQAVGTCYAPTPYYYKQQVYYADDWCY
jgi:hypothetical protein